MASDPYYLLLAVNVAFGISLCYFGVKVVRLLSALFFGLLGFSLALSLLGEEGALLGVFLGGMLAVFGFRLYLLSVFFLGLLAGVSLGGFFFSLESEAGPWVILGLGLLFGFFAVKWELFWIVVSTAWSGAWVLLLTLELCRLGPEVWEKLFGEEEGFKVLARLVFEGRWDSLGWLLFFFFSGMLVQLRARGRERRKEEGKG